MRRYTVSRLRFSALRRRLPDETPLRHPLAAACAGGFVSVFAQGFLLRESLFGRHEAELASGTSLAGWLVAAGVGAVVGSRASDRGAAWALGMLLLPAAAAAGVVLSRLTPIDPAICAIPAGLAAGVLFAAPFSGGTGTAGVSSMEAAGAAAGGLAFALSSRFLLAGTLAIVLAAACSTAALAAGFRKASLPLAAAAACLALGIGGRADILLARQRYGPAPLEVVPSAFGEVAVSGAGEGAAVFRSGLLESYGSAPEAAELTALLPLLASGPGRVLYAGSSPDVVALLDRWPGLDSVDVTLPDDARVPALGGAELVLGDPRIVLEQGEGAYDLILLSPGLPLTILSNRMLTREAFRSARSALRPGGLLAFTLPLGANRLVPVQAELAASLLEASEFRFEEILPLGGAMFLFSDSAIRLPGTPESPAWPDSFLPMFLDSATLVWEAGPGRAEAYAGPLREARAEPNLDLRPAAFALASQDWAVRTGGGGLLSGLFVAGSAAFVLLMLSLARRGTRRAAVLAASTGLSGTAAEMAAVIVVQCTLGTAWTLIGVAVGLFMAGFAAGSALLWKAACARPGRWTAAASADILLIAAACVAYGHGGVGRSAAASIGLAGVLASGLFSGAAFPAAVSIAGKAVSSSVPVVEAASVGAGALAAVVFPLALFPSLGVAGSLAAVGAVCLASSFCLRGNPRPRGGIALRGGPEGRPGTASGC